MKLPIISLAILGAQVGYAYYRDSRPLSIANQLVQMYGGIDIMGGGVFRPDMLAIGYVPWLAKRFLLPIVMPGRALSRMHLPISLS